MTKKNQLNAEDADLFKHATRGTKTLRQTKVMQESPRPAPKVMKRDTYSESLSAPFSDYEKLCPVSVDDRISFNRPGIQHKVLRNLRTGKYNIEARLDLHGMTTETAKEKLHHFLVDCHTNGIRFALIIHGKGRDSQKPIIKNKLNHWLRQTELVQAFCSAAQKDGSSGALYVLIKNGGKTVG